MGKIYLAAPFFNPEQVAFVEQLEEIIEHLDFRMFSPRKGENALEMNGLIAKLKEWDHEVTNTAHFYPPPKPPVPSEELRFRVFQDNWQNIDDADLLLAVIDNFDVGVMWEVGYAFARHVPILTVTNHNHGCNLMLAHSIVGHLKSLDAVRQALAIARPGIGMDESTAGYGEVIAEIQYKFKSLIALKEGPDERQ